MAIRLLFNYEFSLIYYTLNKFKNLKIFDWWVLAFNEIPISIVNILKAKKDLYLEEYNQLRAFSDTGILYFKDN